MNEILADIKEKLDEGLYKNEEQIRFSLVARILKKLDWDIWEPQEVYTEFSPDEGRSRVDVALFIKPQYPSIFIEIKAADKLLNERELQKAEMQLRDYNVNLTALFTILTDGNIWRFYYSQEGGTFSQKCFKIINIQSDDIDDVELAFLTFLAKKEIITGRAKDEASTYLQLNRKQQVMEQSITAAKKEQDNDPLLSLVDALHKVVKDKGIDVDREEIIDFLKSETPKKTIIKTSVKVDNTTQKITPEINNQNTQRRYTLSNPYELTFTKITSGEIDGEYANNWQNLLRVILRQLISSGIQVNEIISISSLNIQQGNVSGSGFHLIPNTNYSLQNVDANKAGAAILKLAESNNKRINIQFFWRDKPGQAAFPNEKCEMIN